MWHSLLSPFTIAILKGWEGRASHQLIYYQSYAPNSGEGYPFHATVFCDNLEIITEIFLFVQFLCAVYCGKSTHPDLHADIRVKGLEHVALSMQNHFT